METQSVPAFVYRIARTKHPDALDFLSDRRRGRPLRDSSDEGARRWDGLSVWGDQGQATRVARRFPSLGRYIAEVRVRPGVTLERSRRAGHYTAYGDPEVFLQAVVRVMPVQYDRGED